MSLGHICGQDSGAAALLARIIERLKDEPCCWGSSHDGPSGCTCWEPVYDLDQQPPIAIAAEHVQTRAEMCADCAFRPDSPERRGDDRYSHNSDEELRELGHFWCHQGMRKPIAWRHPTFGITLDADTDAYAPPMLRVGDTVVPFKASGAPADRCGGFAAWKKAEQLRA